MGRVDKKASAPKATPAAPPTSTHAPAAAPTRTCAHEWTPTGTFFNGSFTQDGPWFCKTCKLERELLPLDEVPVVWLSGEQAQIAALRIEKHEPPAPAAPPVPRPELLRLDDIARRYRISERTVRDWIKKGLIPYVMVGPFRIKYVDPDALEQPVPAKRQEPT